MIKLHRLRNTVKIFKNLGKFPILTLNRSRLPALSHSYSTLHILKEKARIRTETQVSVDIKNKINLNVLNDQMIGYVADKDLQMAKVSIDEDHNDGSIDIFDLMGETKHFSVSQNDRYVSWLNDDELYSLPYNENDNQGIITDSNLLHLESDDDSNDLTTVITNNEKDHLERLRKISEMTTNQGSPDMFILKSFEKLISVVHLQSRLISKNKKPFNWPNRSFKARIISSYPEFPKELTKIKFHSYLKEVISNDYGSKSELDGETYLFLDELLSHKLPEFETFISNISILNLIVSFYARLGDVNGCLYTLEQFEKILGIKPNNESFNLILFSVLQVKKLNKVDKTFKKSDSLSKFIGVILKKSSWFYRLPIDESTFHLLYLIVDTVDIKLRILGMMIENGVDFTIKPVLNDVVATIYRKQMIDNESDISYNDFKNSLLESQMISSSSKHDVLVFNSMIRVKLDDYHNINGALQLIQRHKKLINMETIVLFVNYFIECNELWNALSAMNYLTGRYYKINKMSKGYREKTTKVMFENYKKWFRLLNNKDNFKMLMKTLFHYSFIFVQNKRVNLIGLEKIKEMIWFYENQTGESLVLYDKLTNNDIKFRKEIMDIEWITTENINDNLNNNVFLNKAKVLGYKL